MAETNRGDVWYNEDRVLIRGEFFLAESSDDGDSTSSGDETDEDEKRALCSEWNLFDNPKFLHDDRWFEQPDTDWEPRPQLPADDINNFNGMWAGYDDGRLRPEEPPYDDSSDDPGSGSDDDKDDPDWPWQHKPPIEQPEQSIVECRPRRWRSFRRDQLLRFHWRFRAEIEKGVALMLLIVYTLVEGSKRPSSGW